MRITRTWISRFMDLDNISNEEITTAFNSLGFEVEETIDTSKLNSGLIVGYVEECEKISGTHLSATKVKIGDGKYLDIVCGAPNVAAKQFVIVAPVGAKLANGAVMKEATLQGHKSQGMICALNEIGIPETVLTEKDLDSIYEVKSFVNLGEKIGRPVSSIGFDDYIWDIDLTLNRSDALAATQLLKELGNYFKQKINYYRWDNKIKNKQNASLIDLVIDKKADEFVNTAGYSTFILNTEGFDQLGVKDDLWLKHNGVKSTGNYIYDLANKTAIEMGQPVVMIDYDKVKSEKVNVVLTNYGENNDTVLALKDGANIIDVLGNEVEEKYRVGKDTTRMLVLFFNLDPAFMRKQQKALNSNSTAMQRYIKPEYANKFDLTNEAMKDILDDYGIIDTAFKLEYVKGPAEIHNVYEVTLDYINETLGTNLSVEEIENCFKFLDFDIKSRGNNLTFTVDPNRIDIFGPKDICEEIARLYGYDNIVEVPLTIQANESKNNLANDLKSKTTEYLIGKGFTNIKTYSLTSAEDNKEWNLFGLKNPVKLMSPLSKLREQYRFDLSKSIIDTVVYNANKDHKDLKLFEIADVYHDLTEHETHLVYAMSGDVYNDFRDPKDIEADFFNTKGIAEDIFELYQIDPMKINFEVQENVIDEIHPFLNAKIKINNKLAGFIYKLNPKFESANKIKKTFVCELNLDVLYEQANKKIELKEISKFQASTRDISMEIKDELSYEEMIKTLVSGVNDLTSYKVIDTYQDDEMKRQDTKSIAISFTFNNVEKQLTDKDIEADWKVLLDNAKKLGAKVR